jgi:hypothetical protein
MDSKYSQTPQTLELQSPLVTMDDEMNSMDHGIYSVALENLIKVEDPVTTDNLEFDYLASNFHTRVDGADTSNSLDYVPHIVDATPRLSYSNGSIAPHHGVVKSQHDLAIASHPSPPRSQRKQSESRISLPELYKKMGLENDHAEAKVREERILGLLRAEGFDLGSRTWVRDTPQKDRAHIIDRIYEQTIDEFGFDKALIEIIVRRAIYYTQQGRLRKIRRKMKSHSVAGPDTEMQEGS